MNYSFLPLFVCTIGAAFALNAEGSFFTKRCGAEVENAGTANVDPATERKADELNLQGGERREFQARAYRLAYLRSAVEEFRADFLTTKNLLRKYEIEVQTFPKADKEQLWKGVLMCHYLRALSLSDVKKWLPKTLRVEAPPQAMESLLIASERMFDLAQFRFRLSQKFAALPLDKSILQVSDEKMARIIDDFETEVANFGRMSQPKCKRRAELTLEAEMDQIAQNLELVRKAKLLASNSDIPRYWQDQLKHHLDFMAKYRLQPTSAFTELVQAAEDLR